MQIHASPGEGSLGKHAKQWSAFGKPFQLPIRPQQQRGRMSSAGVIEPSGRRIEPCEEHAGQRRQSRYLAELAVHSRNNRLRLTARSSVRVDQRHQMRSPHPSCRTLAADITQGKDYAPAGLLRSEKVAWQVARGENLAGNLELAVPDQTWGAQTPVH